MVADRYVWFVWSCAMLAAWLGLYLARPRYRHVMLWMSLFTLPFGLSEPLFVHNYWDPPSLFGLARRTNFDIESFIHCFAIGGTAAVLYNVLTARPVEIPPKLPRHVRYQELYNLAVASPAIVLAGVLWLSGQMMVASIAGMLFGAIVRLAYLPSLRAKTLAGGPLFLVYFVLFLLLLAWMAPGYIQRVWLPRRLATPILGMPLSELLFGFTFGMFWSGLYEQWRWTFKQPDPSHAGGAIRSTAEQPSLDGNSRRR